ncbi:DNA-packaging protein [Bacillus haynesii]|uniref:DNA-packaging protein n=1 Tax=Bacillus haynesii TaxID=1925021 RepID=UPI00227ED707|nr:DNA-packaging protein [Bacillus haynesii]MCY9224155.1 DNA-packaging protein [Bacillus haynesii]
MDNLSRAQNKENEIKIENLKGNLSKLEKHTLDTEKEIKGEVEKFSDLVNYHINNKANPHEVTTEQVTIISDPTPYQDASYSGDSYPLGISTFHLAGSASGYPSKYGECLNVKTTKYRFAQFFFNAGNRNDPRIYLRHWYPSTGWTEFITIPSSSDVDDALKSAKAYTDAHANDKTNPHSVTKDQIGLGNVVNEEQATKKEFDTHAADLIKHITADEREKWSAGQLFKITRDDGQPLIYVNATDDFHELLPRYKGFVHFSSHANAINSPGGALKGFWNCNSTGTYGQIIAFDNSNRTYRKSITNGNWSEWEVLETQSGSQAKVDAHANNKTIHVTTAERTKWNNSQLYKLTQDNGVRNLIPDGTDLLTLPPGFYYGVNNRLLNNPEPDNVGWFNYDIMDGNSGRKTIIATASFHNKMWFATIHTNGDFRGWKRILTSTDFEPVWTEVPLKNGAKHGDRRVRCATIGGLLLLEGEIIATRGTVFGTLPASYRPSKLRCKIVPIYGTTGVTKLYIETNGNMRLEGQISDKLENITSYGLDEVIPL